MVDALHEVHRVLVPGGTLIDARPDSRVQAFAEHPTSKSFRRFGVVRTNRVELANDRASDRAIQQVVRERIFKHGRRGRLWHRVPFDSLADLRAYLREHRRFVHNADWKVDAPTLRRHAHEALLIRRAVRYEILEAVP